MGSYNDTPDPEQEYRRNLFAAARKGIAKAREELHREYHVRVYSEEERARFSYVASFEHAKRLSQRPIEITTEWAGLTEDRLLDVSCGDIGI